ncbi:cation:proton antiporter [Williamsia sp. CHRR-6]|uniref:cation:proton antiporter n=1 Tax=Williamsia sp. CHRR-6 TaxID=2835871 RepID=UPI001BDA987C|nr:cation:proton antiporter [Williamsia sp. CHRR-6]MBT0567117.1 cation:proton antiporter [Williamsia sp. CHRR-6]
MSFATLALIGLIGLAGPLLAAPSRLRVPVIIGQLAAGAVFGRSAFDLIDPTEPTLEFLATVGFALVMFVAGSHVPVRDPNLLSGIRIGALRAVAVGVVATGLGWALAATVNSDHIGLYAVVMASSSAAVALPIIESEKVAGPAVLQLLPQIAIADAICIVAVPLVIDRAHAPRAALGSVVVIAATIAVFVVLRYFDANGIRQRLHDVSQQRKFAVELRVNLAILFALAALATWSHVSVLLAGFGFGLAVAAIGEPRRLAKQIFAVADGFLGPLYFVWLGASLDLRDLVRHPNMIAVGVALGLGGVLAHVAMRAFGQPVAVGALAAAQLGVPISASTLGTQLDLFSPGEAPAIILGALITLVAATLGGVRLARTNSQR